MGNLNTNQFSHLTAKQRETLSFPAKITLNQKLLIGQVLDFGCGFGKDVQILSEKGINITPYDSHYFPQYPTQKFDTIICFYVLNVLLPEQQATVLIQISQLLKPTGKAYFAVRRDITNPGFRTHKLHQKPTYQCNIILPYKSIFKNENCEIYEYQHYNQIPKNLIQDLNSDCPFCNPDAQREIIAETATAYAIPDKFPVSNGHTLIIPKIHIPNYFDLTFKQQTACWFLLNNVKQLIQIQYNPDGFNIGININQTAGQTIPHAHIHLIPRYNGDVTQPRGGVRGVIPHKKDY